MNTQGGHKGPEKEDEGRGKPWKAASTPNDHPTESVMASFNGKANAGVEQETAVCAAVPDSKEMFDSKPVLWDSGWQQDATFNIRFRILGAVDGGARRRWAERMLFSPPTGEDTHNANGSAE